MIPSSSSRPSSETYICYRNENLFFTFVVKLIKLKYIIQNVGKVWDVEKSFTITTLDKNKNE